MDLIITIFDALADILESLGGSTVGLIETIGSLSSTGEAPEA